jgi:hypothetical protein
LGEYQCLVQAIINLDHYILKSTLYEVFLQLNQWQDGRLAGKDEVLWARAQAFHFRNLLALSRKVTSRCTSGLRLPVAVQTAVQQLRKQRSVSSSEDPPIPWPQEGLGQPVQWLPDAPGWASRCLSPTQVCQRNPGTLWVVSSCWA